MKFAVANQFLMIADQAGVDYTNVLRAIREDYPRAADLPGPGFAAGPCLFKDTMQLAAFTARSLPARPGRRCRSTRACRPTSWIRADRAVRSADGPDGRHPRHGLQGRIGRYPRIALVQAAQAAVWAGAEVLATDPYVQDDRLVPLDEVLAESEILILGAPHAGYRALAVGGRDVVDVWGAIGEGIRL